MSIIDISVPLTEHTPSWENRFAPRLDWHSQIDSGDNTSNSSWYLHSHSGTHVDAPLHHLVNGGRVGNLTLASMIGPCRVIDLTHVSAHISGADLAAARILPGERILLKTTNSLRAILHETEFISDFVALAPDAAEVLVASGAALVGIDALSIEPYGSHGAATHKAILGAGIVVLEGLDLAPVEAGTYQLVFLPLSLGESEAAPGRAILLPAGETIPSDLQEVLA